MRESDADLERLQALLDGSLAGSNEHLRSIIRPGEHSLTARQLAKALTGMRVLVVATTTVRGEPRTSAADGHFLAGHWVFSTSGTAAKARHLAARPAVSVTHLDGERLGVFTHGSVERLTPGPADFGWVDEYLTEHYGSSPATWGPDIPYFRVRPSWMVAYAADPAAFPE
jgi:hypothetical protein